MRLEKAKEVIRIEATAILELENRINEQFRKTVDIVLKCKGRVIVTGMGKSGIIAQKIASTLSSTGTPALFLHPAEGVHGDLGVVLKKDVVIWISKSGNTDEIIRLFPVFRRLGVAIIGMTGHPDSELGRQSDAVLDVGVKIEACPFDIIPTTSTTATLVMGDALALTLLQERGFSVEDYAQFHPAGDIGKKLFLKIEDVMRQGSEIAKIHQDADLSEAILEITTKRLGATCVMNDNDELVGIITDGDLRRLMEKTHDIWHLKASDIMSPDPKCVEAGVLAAKALNEMETYSINQLLIVNSDHYPIGMVHIHDLLKSGLA